MISFNPVRDNLLLGACPRTPADLPSLTAAGVTALLNLQSDADFNALGIDWAALRDACREAGIEARRCPIIDFDDRDLAQNLPRAVDLLDGMLRAGCRVYVHCNAGRQRSPSVVIGYLAWRENLGLGAAVARVTAARDCDPPLHVLAALDAGRAEHADDHAAAR